MYKSYLIFFQTFSWHSFNEFLIDVGVGHITQNSFVVIDRWTTFYGKSSVSKTSMKSKLLNWNFQKYLNQVLVLKFSAPLHCTLISTRPSSFHQFLFTCFIVSIKLILVCKTLINIQIWFWHVHIHFFIFFSIFFFIRFSC